MGICTHTALALSALLLSPRLLADLSLSLIFPGFHSLTVSMNSCVCAHSLQLANEAGTPELPVLIATWAWNFLRGPLLQGSRCDDIPSLMSHSQGSVTAQ